MKITVNDVKEEMSEGEEENQETNVKEEEVQEEDVKEEKDMKEEKLPTTDAPLQTVC